MQIWPLIQRVASCLFAKPNGIEEIWVTHLLLLKHPSSVDEAPLGYLLAATLYNDTVAASIDAFSFLREYERKSG